MDQSCFAFAFQEVSGTIFLQIFAILGSIWGPLESACCDIFCFLGVSIFRSDFGAKASTVLGGAGGRGRRPLNLQDLQDLHGNLARRAPLAGCGGSYLESLARRAPLRGAKLSK